MAITSEQLQTSIEKFLPRGLNTSRDADSGSLSEDEIAERALLIARISLLLDIESPFQPLSTAVQSFGDGLQTILDSFAELTGDDLLLSLRDEAPSYIDDLSKLESARSNLIGVANTANLDDTFSDTKLDEFASDVDDFLTENIVGKVVNRNRVVIRDEAKALYATLEPLWETALEKKTELLAQVESFVDLDLKKTVVTEIVLAIKQQMDDTISELEEANAEEQAALAEEILCDMAAARAVMKIIQNAPAMESDEVGDPVVIPVIGEAGSTPDDYLQRQGKAILEPIDVVELPSTARYGTGGKISITSIYAGSTGIAPDDGDGDYTTPDFRDINATFVTDGVAEGDYLFLVRDGTTHRITEVTDEKNLVLTPELPIIVVGDTEKRYVITDAPIGLYFEDEDEDFWTEYNDGASGSNVLISGTAGEFEEDTRLEGDNGANAKDYSTAGDGESQPYKTSGTDGQPHGEYLESDTGWCSVEIVSEVDGYSTNPFPVQGKLYSSSATFETDNVSNGDWIYITSGTMEGRPIRSSRWWMRTM